MRSVFILRVMCNTPPSQIFSLGMLGEKVQYFMLPFIYAFAAGLQRAV
jgi:hypothetical protein